MVVPDTSVWVAHLREPDPVMVALLSDDQIAMHPFVIGELALGNLPRRQKFLSDLQDLQTVPVAETAEVMILIEANALYGSGIGWADANLLASILTDGRHRLWTKDRRLLGLANRFNVAFSPVH